MSLVIVDASSCCTIPFTGCFPSFMGACKHTKQENKIQSAETSLKEPGGGKAGTYF